MVNRKYKRAVFGITTALVFSACTFPAMAAVTYTPADESTAVSSSDATYAYGLDLEALIINTVEQDQRSPYANKGIAVTDNYLKIRTAPSNDAEVVGKLYTGSGCEILETSGGWSKIQSGDCEGYVKAKYLLSGTDAESYAEENDVSKVVAKAQSESLYLYEEPSAQSTIVATVLADQSLTVLETTEDGRWAKASNGDKTGYVAVDAVSMDVEYATAISAAQEKAEADAKAAEEAAKAAEEAAAKAAAESEAAESESIAESEAAETETEAETEAETKETEAAETESSVSIKDVDETVWATYNVSVRASYSTDAEKLGVLVATDSVKRTGICDNGWSRVEYDGQTAYINSDYLSATEVKAEETEAETEAPKTETLNETVYATAGVNIRSKASADSDILGTLIAGYSIKRTAESNGWSTVDYNGTTGYIKSEYLTKTKPTVTETTETESKDETSTSSGPSITEVSETVYATSGVNIRSEASADSSKVGSLATGSSIKRTGKTDNGWSRVEFSGTTGYIKSDYLTTEKPADSSSSSSSSSDSSSSSSSSNASLGQQIADFAVQYVGYPYVYGGNSLTNGVDCSGFTQQVYLHFGYSIERRASLQANQGTTVSISNLQPGDLVFYGDSSGVGHVVIYIGNDQVVHASTPTKGIIISSLYYRTPLWAKRII